MFSRSKSPKKYLFNFECRSTAPQQWICFRKGDTYDIFVIQVCLDNQERFGSKNSVRGIVDTRLQEQDFSQQAGVYLPKIVRFIPDSWFKVSGLWWHTCNLIQYILLFFITIIDRSWGDNVDISAAVYMSLYLDNILPTITQPGDDRNYGSAAMYDALCLQARLLSTMILLSKCKQVRCFRDTSVSR